MTKKECRIQVALGIATIAHKMYLIFLHKRRDYIFNVIVLNMVMLILMGIAHYYISWGCASFPPAKYTLITLMVLVYITLNAMFIAEYITKIRSIFHNDI